MIKKASPKARQVVGESRMLLIPMVFYSITVFIDNDREHLSKPNVQNSIHFRNKPAITANLFEVMKATRNIKPHLLQASGQSLRKSLGQLARRERPRARCLTMQIELPNFVPLYSTLFSESRLDFFLMHFSME